MQFSLHLCFIISTISSSGVTWIDILLRLCPKKKIFLRLNMFVSRNSTVRTMSLLFAGFRLSFLLQHLTNVQSFRQLPFSLVSWVTNTVCIICWTPELGHLLLAAIRFYIFDYIPDNWSEKSSETILFLHVRL